MLIGVVAETEPHETRVAASAETVKKFLALGAEAAVERGAGVNAGILDADYAAAGARLVSTAEALGADVVLKVRRPSGAELGQMKRGALVVASMDPYGHQDAVAAMAEAGVAAFAMELLPRITRAQTMDVLSSQANLAGYRAVIDAAAEYGRALPMMMTAAGAVPAAKAFVMGVGVAGLQAIATAKRLGAKVTAYDTRPVVEEQVKSLGAQFFKIDLGETGQTKDGYARALTEEQVQKQRDAMKKTCGESDVVITAAQVFGRRAPILVTAEMLNAMKPGSVVVDLAVETGGNVEGVVYDQVTDRNGVKIVGIANLPARVPLHASQVYSANLTSLIEEFWDKQNKNFILKLDDEIIKGCLVTHGGKIVNEKLVAKPS